MSFDRSPLVALCLLLTVAAASCASDGGDEPTATDAGAADAQAAALEAAREDGEGEDEVFREVIDLKPEDLASFGMKNLSAPIASFFRGFGHYYTERAIEVDTTPSGGMVDLFYVRSNFQKRFEQADTPVSVIVPARVDAGPRDSLTIRAFREGFRQKTTTIKIGSSIDEVIIDLEPLPNTLDGLSHRYFAGRSTVGFLTGESLDFRVQEAADGFSVILTETAMAMEARAALDHMRSPLIGEVYAQQLGEDLLVKVSLTDAAVGATEVRSRQQYNAARDLHEFVLELVPNDGGSSAVQNALDALASITTTDVTGCALGFDGAMREQLDPGALNRALSPQGAFTDRYVRAAMRRLGEVTPGGVVAFAGGSKYSPAVPIELEVSLNQAAGAQGFLALLRTFVFDLEQQEYQAETYRSLIAPELDSSTFEVVLEKANAAQEGCLAAS
jgi:hypothetical protein